MGSGGGVEWHTVLWKSPFPASTSSLVLNCVEFPLASIGPKSPKSLPAFATGVPTLNSSSCSLLEEMPFPFCTSVVFIYVFPPRLMTLQTGFQRKPPSQFNGLPLVCVSWMRGFITVNTARGCRSSILSGCCAPMKQTYFVHPLTA